MGAFVLGGALLFCTLAVLFWLQSGGTEWLAAHERARKRAQFALTMYGLVYLYVSLVTDVVAYSGLQSQLCKHAPPIAAEAPAADFALWSVDWGHCPLQCGVHTCTASRNEAFSSLVTTPLTALLVITWLKEATKCVLFVYWLTNGHHQSKRLQYVLRNMLALPASICFGRSAFLRQYYAPGKVDQVKFQAVDALLQQLPQTILMLAITFAKGVLPTAWTAFSLLLALTGTLMAVSPIFSRVNAHVKEARSTVLEFVGKEGGGASAAGGGASSRPPGTSVHNPLADTKSGATNGAPKQQRARGLGQGCDPVTDHVDLTHPPPAAASAADMPLSTQIVRSPPVGKESSSVAGVDALSSAAIARFLSDAGLVSAAGAFETNDVDGTWLAHLDLDTLTDLGISNKVERLRVMSALRKLPQTAAGSASTASDDQDP